MKLVSESPEDDRVMKEMLERLNQEGPRYVYGECFADSFAKNTLADALMGEQPSNEEVLHWDGSQRLWFLEMCHSFVNTERCKELVEDFQHLIGIYDLIFREEREALVLAKQDYSLYLALQKEIDSQGIDSYKDLERFVRNGVGTERIPEIKKLFFSYDENLSQYVLELNSIKVPVVLEDKKLKEDAVIYAWCDSECGFAFEFLKYDLLEKKMVGEIQPKEKVLEQENLRKEVAVMDMVH